MSDVMPTKLLLGGRGGVTKTGSRVYSETDSSDQDKFMKSLGTYIQRELDLRLLIQEDKLVKGFTRY